MGDFKSSYEYVFSLGYRCSSAGILKSLGLKTESYPFDWMVSRLPIIEDCIQTEFIHFLSSNSYKCVQGVTNNYTSLDPSSRQYICNESICFNEHYETNLDTTISNRIKEFYLPEPICAETDAYGYKLMMNHRNIKHNQEDREYLNRCVERWNIMMHSNKRKLALYIHPVIFYDAFLKSKQRIMDDIRKSYCNTFGNIMYSQCDGIYIIPVKTPFEYPTNHCAKYVLEEQPDDESVPDCRICILWANRDLIDAGEIFMGNCHVETYVIKDYIQKTFENKGLL
jgi:hypothetical protein